MKIKGFKPLLFLILSFYLFSSCSKYNALYKSDNIDEKYKAAQEYYNKGDYYHALGLFEDLLPYYKGTKEMENLYYYYSFCYYYQNEYLLAAYNFKNYYTTYPNTFNAEECLFMSAKCYFLLSPDTQLDQGDTEKAMDELQLFVNTFPKSMRIPEANDMLDKLRGKLETKAFEGAMLYYNMQNWNAAAISFSNLLHDFPDTPDAEKANYFITNADYQYAVNSIDSKIADRLEIAQKACKHYLQLFPSGAYLKEINSINDNITKLLNKTTE